MARLRYGNVHGTLTNTILSSDTTFRVTYDSSSSKLPALSGGNYYVLILEPDTLNQEIIYVTNIATSANGDGSYTINACTRGQESTSAIGHNGGKAWLHGPTVSDFVGGSGGSVALLGPITFNYNAASIGTPYTLFSGLNAGQVILTITGFVNTAFVNTDSSIGIDLGTNSHGTTILSNNTGIQIQDVGAGTEMQASGSIYGGPLLVNTGGTSIVATLRGNYTPTAGSIVFYMWVT